MVSRGKQVVEQRQQIAPRGLERERLFEHHRGGVPLRVLDGHA